MSSISIVSKELLLYLRATKFFQYIQILIKYLIYIAKLFLYLIREKIITLSYKLHCLGKTK